MVGTVVWGSIARVAIRAWVGRVTIRVWVGRVSTVGTIDTGVVGISLWLSLSITLVKAMISVAPVWGISVAPVSGVWGSIAAVGIRSWGISVSTKAVVGISLSLWLGISTSNQSSNKQELHFVFFLLR